MGLLATSTLEVVTFRVYAPFPAPLPFRMQVGSRVLWGCSAPPVILPRSAQVCRNGGLSILTPIGETETNTVSWGRQSCCIWSKIPWWKLGVRLLDLIGMLGRILCEQIPLISNKKMSMLLTLLFTCLFSVSVSLDSPYTAHAFFHGRLSNHCQGLPCTFSEICTKCHAVPLSDPSRNLIVPDTRLQTKWRKESTFYPTV
jgi:hypothetical protein